MGHGVCVATTTNVLRHLEHQPSVDFVVEFSVVLEEGVDHSETAVSTCRGASTKETQARMVSIQRTSTQWRRHRPKRVAPHLVERRCAIPACWSIQRQNVTPAE